MNANRWMILIAMAIPIPCLGQDIFGVDEFVEPGRPEAWGMAYATAATLYHGLEVPDRTELWDLELALEISNIPTIDDDKTRVGFDGTKLEDLNKSPVFGRGRLALGLPADFTLELAYTPPISINGVRADGIYGIALGRPVFLKQNWRLGARAFGQWGHAKGDITCSREVAAFGTNDFINNPFGCRGPSEDDTELDHYGLELSAAWQRGRWSPFLAWSIARIHPEVQINAPVFNYIDQTRLVSKDQLRSGTLGIQYSGSRGMNWYLAGSWTPLDVDRGEGLQSDDFWSVHLMLRLEVGQFFGD